MKDDVQSGYKPAQDEVLRTLGLAVLAGQGIERLMSSCLTFPLRDEPLQTAEQLHALLGRHSKSTLGQLLTTLRKRVGLHPTFDHQFERFLDSRNLIAHRLHDLPGGLDLHSEEGRAKLKTFLLQFLEDGEALSMVFLGLIREWTRQAGIDLPGAHHLNQRIVDHLDANVVPNLDELIRSKNQNAAP